MNRYRIQFDVGYKAKGKKMDPESETQPDMSLTVRQLLENHTRGVESDAQAKTPLYFDIEVPTIKDLTDIEEYRDHLEAKLKQTDEFIQQELHEAADRREEEAHQAEIDAEEEEKRLKEKYGPKSDA